MKNNRLFDLLIGGAFVVIGIMALNRPVATLGFLVFFFGILAIVRGATAVLGLGAMKNKESKGFRIFLGLFDIIIGIMFLTNVIRGALFLGIMFAVWFLIESIGHLFLTTRFKRSKGMMKMLVLLFDILCMIFAVMLLFNPIIATLTLPKLVGFSAITFGFVLMVEGFNAKENA
ncbi:HdeD family acid-resistance protein [Enterococcus sp. LJL98]